MDVAALGVLDAALPEHRQRVRVLDGGGYGADTQCVHPLGDFDQSALLLGVLRDRIEQRRRNFRHLLRSVEFRSALGYHRGEDFVDAYLDATGLDGGRRARLRAGLIRDLAVAPVAS